MLGVHSLKRCSVKVFKGCPSPSDAARFSGEPAEVRTAKRGGTTPSLLSLRSYDWSC